MGLRRFGRGEAVIDESVLSPELVAYAGSLGFQVRVVPKRDMPHPDYEGCCDPARMEIRLSSSLDPEDDLSQMLAHEIGHAEQWRDGKRYWELTPMDPVIYFSGEMDAIARGRKHVPDMGKNFWANYHFYMKVLGLDHMGRS